MSAITITNRQVQVDDHTVIINSPSLTNAANDDRAKAVAAIAKIEPTISAQELSVDAVGRVIVKNRALAEKMAVQPLSSNNGILCGGPTVNFSC